MTKEEGWQKFCEEKMPTRRDYKFPQYGMFWDCWLMAWRAGYLEGLKSITKDKENGND